MKATLMLVLVLQCGILKISHAPVSRSYALKAYDCYRPQQAVADFVQWAGCAPLLYNRFSQITFAPVTIMT